MNNKTKKGLETKQLIINNSAQLFARYGYSGITIRKIASKVGIKESSIYNHFKGKADILDKLYDEFIKNIPLTRPSDTELDQMLMIMEPDEIFKNILFQVGKSVNGVLSNVALIIDNEKYRNARAAEIYYKYVIAEPATYYEKLINKMIQMKMIKNIDARIFAEQYIYISNALTKEYIMAQYGFGDVYAVVGYMVKTLKFFCHLMKNGDIDRGEGEKK